MLILAGRLDTRKLVYTMFISNNRVSFHLWWKENLVKIQKVSKYENDCRNVFKGQCSLVTLFMRIGALITNTSLKISESEVKFR